MIQQLEQEIRDFINDIIFQYKEKNFSFILKKLKLKAQEYKELCAALDLLGDTELAKNEFFEAKIGPDGKGYLYLYGFLNSVYLQEQAIKSIAQIFKLKDRGDWNEQLNSLELSNVTRSILGAHTLSTDGYHMISRNSIEGKLIVTLNSEGRWSKFDLKDQCKKYNECVKGYLKAVVAKVKVKY